MRGDVHMSVRILQKLLVAEFKGYLKGKSSLMLLIKMELKLRTGNDQTQVVRMTIEMLEGRLKRKKPPLPSKVHIVKANAT